MANPARPVTLDIIDTAWGRAVADSVVRVYPNAATRDADLAGFSAAELLGQCCVLTDTGSLLIYAGPLAGWRPPWNTAWGHAAAPVTSGLDANIGGGATSYMLMAAAPFIAGRRYQAVAEFCYVSDAKGYVLLIVDGANSVHRTEIRPTANGEVMKTPIYNYAATTTRTANVDLQGVTINFQGTKGQGRLSLTDVGPAANPTAILLDDDGVERVHLDLLDPEYRDAYDLQAAAQLAVDLDLGDVDG